MSVRHSDKCSKEIAKKFLVDRNKIPYKKIRGLTAYEGEVRIYNGLYNVRSSQKRVRQYDESGCFLAKTTIRTPMFISTFRDEWEDRRYQAGEKRAIKGFFKL